ncbi:MAG: hypothetical protein WKF30_17260 [Pyrinomonadaceae bacterium]
MTEEMATQKKRPSRDVATTGVGAPTKTLPVPKISARNAPQPRPSAKLYSIFALPAMEALPANQRARRRLHVHLRSRTSDFKRRQARIKRPF